MFRLADAEIDRLLGEDVPYFDLTTQALGIGGVPGRMIFRAGAAQVACATEEAARLLCRAGAEVELAAASGTPLQAGGLLLTATGPAAALLAGWKVAQTLVEYASGIASRTRQIVDAAQAVNPAVAIACTRKNFPGTKAVAVKAILAGGATPHRLGLSETVLVFPEHRAFLGATPLAETVAALKRACPEKKIVIEVTSLAEAEAAAAAGADVLQLEKFAPAAVAQVVERLGAQVAVAAAGGINAGNAADYAATGATILVTSAPYQAPPLDVKVTIEAR